MKELQIKSSDGNLLHIYLWDKVENLKGVLQIVHGSCEHLARYDEFANYLNDHGWIVIGNDHRGHGKTAALQNQPLGFFGEDRGWAKLVEDTFVVNKYISETYANLPIAMLGHSMGSFIARTYIILHSKTIKAVILSGTAWYSNIQIKMARRMAKKHQKKFGATHIDDFIYNLSYKPLNKKYKKSTTGADWLSVDQDNVAKFVADPLCGFTFTSSGFKDLFSGLIYNQTMSKIENMDKNLPIMLVAGKEDPVGSYGKTVTKTYKKFNNQGLNVDMKLYPGVRHEILFDITKDKVMEDAMAFINQAIEKPKSNT
ncbi:lysophospholipase [Spiroplasma sp. TIUS-1]|uniref:alpha/beta fold hydrolase n=1 Tax=Spiroplasma sp. TIUS-1 TaxID=216963 RepID=UPI001399148B|nr:alpha/beta fold hydrolase [Spiroplasma sp. TIUS-1]QHX35718.1 lysophospholipase [Spiroplasma sp. TIUS-1]